MAATSIANKVKSGSLLVGNAFYDPSNPAFESIQTVTVGSATPYIEFTSIPSTYKNLQIRGIAKNSESYSASAPIIFTFNSDTGNNYSNHKLYGTGSGTPGTQGSANDTGYYIWDFPRSASGREYMYGGFIVDILDYANTNKYKTARALVGMNTNGQDGEYMGLQSGAWRNTNAISTIRITAYGGFNHNQYSQFALYGVKG